MSSRVAGAALALTATALLNVSIVTSAWWSGHPESDGASMQTKEVAVGLLGSAKGCNTGGDGSCTQVPLRLEFIVVKYVELGLIELLGLAAIGVAAASLRRAKRRRLFARLTLVSAVVAIAGGIVVIATGPGINAQTTVTVPFGYGLYVFFVGVAFAIGAAVATLLGLRVPAQPTVALPVSIAEPSRPSVPPAQPDALALFRGEATPAPVLSVPPPPMFAPPAPASAFVGVGGSTVAPKPPVRAKPPSNAPPIPPPRPIPKPPTPSAIERAATDTDPAVALFGDTTSRSVPLQAGSTTEIQVPISTAPDSLPPPNTTASSGPSPACPQCEAPMAWVDEHLRFYCKSCRMYF